MKSKKNFHTSVSNFFFFPFSATGMFNLLQAQTVNFMVPYDNDQNSGSQMAPFESISTAQDKACGQKGDVIVYNG